VSYNPNFHVTVLDLLGLDKDHLWSLKNGRNETLTASAAC
jgi:hypothetical protein